MPYKCVSCSHVYEDGSNEVLAKCASCGSKFFFYIKKDKLVEIEKHKEMLPFKPSETKQIERDIRQIAGIEDEETPIFLDFESIRAVKPGKYLLDLQKLFEIGKPRVYQIEDGKYIVDLGGVKGHKSI
jgi:predicted  nucleic acid-binding Zn-ribbon protein